MYMIKSTAARWRMRLICVGLPTGLNTQNQTTDQPQVNLTGQESEPIWPGMKRKVSWGSGGAAHDSHAPKGYRMHPSIRSFPSSQFYESMLEDSVSIPHRPELNLSFNSILCHFDESQVQASEDWFAFHKPFDFYRSNRKMILFFSLHHHVKSFCATEAAFSIQLRPSLASTASHLDRQLWPPSTCGPQPSSTWRPPTPLHSASQAAKPWRRCSRAKAQQKQAAAFWSLSEEVGSWRWSCSKVGLRCQCLEQYLQGAPFWAYAGKPCQRPILPAIRIPREGEPAAHWRVRGTARRQLATTGHFWRIDVLFIGRG